MKKLYNLPKKTLLCILDGWGISSLAKDNAVYLAQTPNYDALCLQHPYCALEASGEAVGLPASQMGNSEVGHMNIGAGRIVEQILSRIDRYLIEGNPAQTIPLWQRTLLDLKRRDKRLHLLGLVSNGRVHGCHQQLIALARSATEAGVTVCIHAISDGRDSSPQGLRAFLDDLCIAVPDARLCTLIGRYYALDRDQRWERTAQAWKLLRHGEGQDTANWHDAIQYHYDAGITDEFLPAMRLDVTYTGFAEDDVLMCSNYRTDRIRQIVRALQDKEFSDFVRNAASPLQQVLSMVHYGSELTTPLFQRENIQDTLGETVAAANRSQVRIAETEKFPHVTYFFNGGREGASDNEQHRLVASQKVASYDLAPEMSASGISQEVHRAIVENAEMIIVNYANPDMVGHTGNLKATVQAVEAVDQALGDIVPNALQAGYTLLITADHGNAEMLWDHTNNMPHTAHTNNPVRLIIADPSGHYTQLNDGVLGDIAPTILSIMDIQIPKAMTGRSLISFKS